MKKKSLKKSRGIVVFPINSSDPLKIPFISVGDFLSLRLTKTNQAFFRQILISDTIGRYLYANDQRRAIGFNAAGHRTPLFLKNGDGGGDCKIITVKELRRLNIPKKDDPYNTAVLNFLKKLQINYSILIWWH